MEENATAKERWAQWRTAEAAVETKGIDAAAETLPPKLAWLLRAIEAARKGDLKAFKELETDAEVDLLRLSVVGVASASPGSFDPTKVRATVKRAGLRNEPFPALDLVRLLTVAINGGKTTPSPALKGRLHERPVLTAAIAGLYPKFAPYRLDDELEERCPRFGPVYIAALVRHGVHADFHETIERYAPSIPRFGADEWPDIGVRYRDGERVTHLCRSCGAGLNRFLRSPLEEPWTYECADEVADAMNDAGHGPELLGKLLNALDDLVRAGRLTAARPIVEACRDLSHHVPNSQRAILRGQLEALDMRIQMLVEAADARTLGIAWKASRTMPQRDRAAVAHRIIKGPQVHWPGEFEVIAAALGDGFLADERPTTLAQAISGMPVHLQREALSQLPEGRRALVEGFCQGMRKNTLAAVQLATKSLENRANVRDVGELLLMACTFWTSGKQPRRNPFLRAVCQHLEKRARMGLRLEPFEFAVLQAIAAGRVGAGSDELARALGAHLPPVSKPLNALGAEHLVAFLEISLLAEGPALAQDRFRAFGRWLRAQASGEQLAFALLTATRLSMRLGKEPRANQEDVLSKWESAMTALLARAGEGKSLKAAIHLVKEEQASPDWIEIWIRKHPELCKSPKWKRLHQYEPDRIDSPFGELVPFS